MSEPLDIVLVESALLRAGNDVGALAEFAEHEAPYLVDEIKRLREKIVSYRSATAYWYDAAHRAQGRVPPVSYSSDGADDKAFDATVAEIQSLRADVARAASLESFIQSVKAMRGFQKAYFRTRDSDTLVIAKAAERQVDEWIALTATTEKPRELFP